jgi:hypothetical protein
LPASEAEAFHLIRAHLRYFNGPITLACPALGACVAVGDFGRQYHTEPSTGFSQAEAVSESDGIWGRPLQITLPSDAAVGNAQQAQLYSVSCTASGPCVAIGSYQDRLGTARSIVVGESAGAWGQPPELMLPANAKSAEGSESGGVWDRAVTITLAPNLRGAGGREDQLDSVSCADPRSCVAVGQYDIRGGAQVAMAVSRSKGVWGRAREVALSSGAGLGLQDGLQSLACPALRACVALGDGLVVSTAPQG